MDALFRPSNLPTLVKCPGSWELCAMFPDVSEETEAAAEGTAAHEVGANILRSFEPGKPLLLLGDCLNKPASNGVLITKEIYDSARDYANSVLRVSNQRGLLRHRHIEEPLTCEMLHPDCWGTPDCWAYDEKTGDLFVWDFKHGHLTVEVFENYQLIAYALGALSKLGLLDGIKDQHIRVHMIIVQPRAHHLEGTERTWTVQASDLRSYQNVIVNTIESVLLGDAKTRAGNHCMFCTARAHCETLARAVGAVLEFVGSATGIPSTPRSAAVELDIIERAEPLLKARKSGISEYVEAQIRKGEQVPFFGLAPTLGNLKWVEDQETILIVADGFDLDLRKPLELITPTQALAAGMDESLVKSFAKKLPTGHKLTRDLGDNARRVFTKDPSL
jgi:Protein of unknown function (DUF2800)